MAPKSKTAKYYAANPAARKQRLKQQAAYNKSEKQVAKRVELNRINRQNHAAGKSKVSDGRDVSHKKGGGTTLEKASTNRARNRSKK